MFAAAGRSVRTLQWHFAILMTTIAAKDEPQRSFCCCTAIQPPCASEKLETLQMMEAASIQAVAYPFR